MKNIYLILGYGVPRNILKDEHYNHYLKIVFNRIFEEVEGKEASVIFSGGPTDMKKPYRRTEAKEMKRLFEKLTTRSFLKQLTKGWRFYLEEKSLSTLENLLYSFQVMQRMKVRQAQVTIFCEYTRIKKVSVLSRKIFNKQLRFRVSAVDFDVSPNRYDTKLVEKKEAEDIKFSLWALRSEDNLKKYRKVFRDKVEYLRTLDPKKHPQAIKHWWQKKLKDFAASNGYSDF